MQGQCPATVFSTTDQVTQSRTYPFAPAPPLLLLIAVLVLDVSGMLTLDRMA
ncbi:MAG: hypothetical protein JO354_05955 [Verrucomicrobia bacterium]|nr:hypothetical protein [Verrucomicrobiota bacterium]